MLYMFYKISVLRVVCDLDIRVMTYVTARFRFCIYVCEVPVRFRLKENAIQLFVMENEKNKVSRL